MEQFNTPFGKRCEILGELWLDYRQDDEFKDFCEYNDLGLPLGFAAAENIIEPNEIVENYVNETWEILITAMQIPDDGFVSLDELLGRGDFA